NSGPNVFLITLPCLPGIFTTAQTATTLCTQIIFPAAAPIICAAKTINGSAPMEFAIFIWIGEKVNVETVALPVMNEPSAPKNGATNNQSGPKVAAIFWTIYSGIIYKSLVLIPGFIKTGIIDSVATSVIHVILMVDNDSLLALAIFLKDFL